MERTQLIAEDPRNCPGPLLTGRAAVRFPGRRAPLEIHHNPYGIFFLFKNRVESVRFNFFATVLIVFRDSIDSARFSRVSRATLMRPY